MPHTSEGVHTAPLSQRSSGICFSHAAYARVLRSTLKGPTLGYSGVLSRGCRAQSAQVCCSADGPIGKTMRTLRALYVPLFTQHGPLRTPFREIRTPFSEKYVSLRVKVCHRYETKVSLRMYEYDGAELVQVRIYAAWHAVP
jgi:hypothetical protein